MSSYNGYNNRGISLNNSNNNPSGTSSSSSSSSASYSYSTYTSYSSSSYSSSTTTSNNGGGQQTYAYAEETYSDPSGSQRRTLTKEPGRPLVEERSSHPSNGGPATRYVTSGGGVGSSGGGGIQERGRIEDVTDREELQEEESEADRRYRENIELEYAKREGGA